MYFIFISCVYLAVLLGLFWSYNAHADSAHGITKASTYEKGSSYPVSQISCCVEKGLSTGDFQNF